MIAAMNVYPDIYRVLSMEADSLSASRGVASTAGHRDMPPASLEGYASEALPFLLLRFVEADICCELACGTDALECMVRDDPRLPTVLDGVHVDGRTRMGGLLIFYRYRTSNSVSRGASYLAWLQVACRPQNAPV